MELFQRVKKIASELAGSETKLAAKLGTNQRTLNGYLRGKRQDNLWPLLPKILEVYPQISREWLYFGEGEMMCQEGVGLRVVAQPLRAVAHVQTPPSIDAEAFCREREKEIAVLRELVSSQKETIASLHELLSSQKETIASQKGEITLQKLMLQQTHSPFTPSDGPELAGDPHVVTASPARGAHTSTVKTKR